MPTYGGRDRSNSKNFFYKMEVGDLMKIVIEIGDDEKLGEWFRQFVLDLHSDDVEKAITEYAAELIVEANGFRKRKSSAGKKGAAAKKQKGQYTDDFERFWSAYPRKTGKGYAFECWIKHSPPTERVLEALEWQKRQEQWVRDDGQYVPMPSTWINQWRWEDEPDEKLVGEQKQYNFNA